MCVVCMEYKPNMLMCNCGHICLCEVGVCWKVYSYDYDDDDDDDRYYYHGTTPWVVMIGGGDGFISNDQNYVGQTPFEIELRMYLRKLLFAIY